MNRNKNKNINKFMSKWKQVLKKKEKDEKRKERNDKSKGKKAKKKTKTERSIIYIFFFPFLSLSLSLTHHFHPLSHLRFLSSLCLFSLSVTSRLNPIFIFPFFIATIFWRFYCCSLLCWKLRFCFRIEVQRQRKMSITQKKAKVRIGKKGEHKSIHSEGESEGMRE